MPAIKLDFDQMSTGDEILFSDGKIRMVQHLMIVRYPTGKGAFKVEGAVFFSGETIDSTWHRLRSGNVVKAIHPVEYKKWVPYDVK